MSRLIFRVVLFFSIALFVGACSSPSDIGLDLIDTTGSTLEYTDSVSTRLTTMTEDSVLNISGSIFFIGQNTDPVFGVTRSELYTNFELSATQILDDLQGGQLDSIVLNISLNKKGHVGNYTQPQTWEVLRLADQISTADSYYSDTSIVIGEVLNAGHTFVPQFVKPILIQDTSGVDTASAVVRIPLDTSVLAPLLLRPSDTTLYDNSSKFQAYFKGLCIRPATSGPNSAILSMYMSDTYFTIYYTKSGVQRKYIFKQGLTTKAFCHFDHDHTGTDVLANDPFSEEAYIQGLGGCFVKVEFPHIQDLQNIIVSKAELVLEVVSPDNDQFYNLPARLSAHYLNEDGVQVAIDDILQETASSLPRVSDGFLAYGDSPGRSFSRIYKLNMSDFFQKIIDGETLEKAIYVHVRSGYNSTTNRTWSAQHAERVVIGNQNSLGSRPVLRFTYSRLPE